ncbi:hypothetical protein [Enterobacter wuhouensis]|uniref:hypothetical protein n=1 Tax=Enterobacter wuhouensis TaxID=2529381 RepID=UPI002FDCCDC3
MSNIDKRALRAELSNPAIGSNAHLRKLALALLDELEVATDACNGWQKKFSEADERLVAAERRIAELTEKPIGWTDEHELRDVEKHGCGYLFNANPITPYADPRRVILLYAAAAGKGE